MKSNFYFSLNVYCWLQAARNKQSAKNKMANIGGFYKAIFMIFKLGTR